MNLLQKDPFADPDSIMLDLETMGLGPNAAVIQIGARPFNMLNGKISSNGLLIDVDLYSSLMIGGEVDDDTVRWWRERGGLKPEGPRRTMPLALSILADFFGKYPTADLVWAQGPSFDIAVLEGYYGRMGRKTPWTFHRARDTRTVYQLARAQGWEKPREGETAHQALADCDQQIAHLCSALAALPRPNELVQHRMDYDAVQAAGFDSPGELLAAYQSLLAKVEGDAP
jgi:exodeoxyribonuclease VIII